MRQTFIIAALLCPLANLAAAQTGGSSYVEYQGQKVPVAKFYSDFDDYKNDPNNLTKAQAKVAANLVRNATFGPHFKDSMELIAALGKLQFPGYGYFLANQVGAKLDPKLELTYVEVPQAGENRYFVLELEAGGAYRVVADFVAPSEPEITRVKRGPGGELEYRDAKNTLIPTKKRGA